MQSNWEGDTLRKEAESGRIVQADSLSELALKIGIPPKSLEYTIEKWNLDVAQGKDTEFEKKAPQLLPISQSPYYAADLRPHVVGITYTGLKIDGEARLLDDFGRPIPDFYAAGEVAGGLEDKVYPGGGYSVGAALVFGRIAGRNAALGTERRLSN